MPFTSLWLLAGCGDTKQASNGSSFFEQVAAAKKISDPETRARKLFAIANEQLRAQDSSGAQDTLAVAEKACQEVAAPAAQSRLLAQLAYNHAKCRNDSAARRAISSARAATDKIKLEKLSDYRGKVLALTALAQAYHAIRDTGEAVAALRAAETVNSQAQGSEESALRRTQAENLSSIASIYQVVERPEEGQRVAAQALDVARQSSKADDRADLLGSVAAVQGELKMPEAAETFELAEKAADEITELHLRGAALVALAGKLRNAGKRDEASRLLEKAQQVAEKVKDKAFRAGLEKDIRDAQSKL